MNLPSLQVCFVLTSLLATSGCHTGPTPIPKSLEEMKSAVVGGGWWTPGRGYAISLASDGLLQAWIVDSHRFFPEPCPFPTELLGTHRWTLSNYMSGSSDEAICTIIVESAGTAPSEYRLRLHSCEQDSKEDEFDHLEWKRGVCRWDLQRVR